MSLSTPSTSVPNLVAGAHDAPSQAALAAWRKAFRALHERGCFVIPNPWDVGSARYLQHLGFPALATTSAVISAGFCGPGAKSTSAPAAAYACRRRADSRNGSGWPTW